MTLNLLTTVQRITQRNMPHGYLMVKNLFVTNVNKRHYFTKSGVKPLASAMGI